MKLKRTVRWIETPGGRMKILILRPEKQALVGSTSEAIPIGRLYVVREAILVNLTSETMHGLRSMVPLW